MDTAIFILNLFQDKDSRVHISLAVMLKQSIGSVFQSAVVVSSTWPRINHGRRSKTSQDFRYSICHRVADGSARMGAAHITRSLHRDDWSYRFRLHGRD